MLLLAEQKKQAVREMVQSLREQFQKITSRNSSLPPHLAINHKVSFTRQLHECGQNVGMYLV
jgi:hypothetical protein